jgi:3-oxoacyl-(acyl-carrier-protein) synthase
MPFRSFRESESVAREMFGSLRKKGLPDVIVSSANGTFADEVERKVFSEFYPSVPVYAPKPAVGEVLGESALLQVAIASLALRNQELPGTLAAGSKLPSVNRKTRSCSSSQALVTAVGFNHQVNALTLCLIQSPH